MAMESDHVKTPAQPAEEAPQAGRAYARDAVNAAGKKLHDAQGPFQRARDACAQYIADEPVKAALISAAAGAVLTTLVMSLLRGRLRG